MRKKSCNSKEPGLDLNVFSVQFKFILWFGYKNYLITIQELLVIDAL